VRCIPDLSESIYSLFVHIKTPNHGLESSFDNGLSLQFPEFTAKALIGQNDIYVDMQPLTTSSDDMSNLSVQSDTPFCRKLSDVAEIVDQEIKQSNNILRDLRNYYSQVKTNRQLGFEVPAGFCQAKFQRVFQARDQLHLKQCVLRHISAHGLHSLVAPASLKQHSKVLPSDKQIWDDAYDKE